MTDSDSAGLDRPGPGVPSATLRMLRPVRRLQEKLVELWRSRELLRQFVGKELKVRYKNSALGFLWSMLTPILMTIVFTIIFSTLIKIKVGGDFASFFISGYLLWLFHQNAVQGSISSVVGNGPLIKKVYFPREILPLSIVVSQVVHLMLAILAISPYLIYARGWAVVTHLPSVLLGVVLVTIFTSGIAMFFAGANVGFRDLQELIVVIFLVWFYATPIIYPLALVERNLGGGRAAFFGWILKANPMTWFTQLFRKAIYGTVVVKPGCGAGTNCAEPFKTLPQSWPSPELLLACTGAALAAFVIGYLLFHRFALSFAKEV